jgi:hypothetical protein
VKLKITMTIQCRGITLNRFIETTFRDVLHYEDRDMVEIVKAHAESEFYKYSIVQHSPFQRVLSRLLKQFKSCKKIGVRTRNQVSTVIPLSRHNSQKAY